MAKLLANGSAVAVIATFIIAVCATPDIHADSARRICLERKEDKFVFWQALNLDDFDNGCGFVKIRASITNTANFDTCSFSSNLYIKDKISHEFSSMQLYKAGDNIDAHFKFVPFNQNTLFLKPGIIYRLSVAYIMTYKFASSMRSKTYYENFTFTIIEEQIVRLKKNTASENDYISGIEVPLIPESGH